jgi:hypothetical protein
MALPTLCGKPGRSGERISGRNQQVATGCSARIPPSPVTGQGSACTGPWSAGGSSDTSKCARSPSEPVESSVGSTGPGQRAEWGVHRAIDQGSPQSHCFGDRGVGVRSAPVDRPVGRAPFRQPRGCIDHTGHRCPIRRVDHDGVAELVGVEDDLGLAPEDGPVELDGPVVVPGSQLEPSWGTRLVEQGEAGKRARFPATDRRAGGIGEHALPAEIGDRCRRKHHLTPMRGRGCHHPRQVGSGQVDLPGVIGRLGTHGAHSPGHRNSVTMEHEVAAEFGARVLCLPTEQLAVEAAASVHVGRPEVGPAGGTDRNSVTSGHGILDSSVGPRCSVARSGRYPVPRVDRTVASKGLPAPPLHSPSSIRCRWSSPR